MKQAIIVRKDLKMSCGKIAGQVAHGSIRAFEFCSSNEDKRRWFEEGEVKIVLKVYSEQELRNIATKTVSSGLEYADVRDAGKTQLAPGTLTAIAIGPYPDEIIDNITQGLKLL